MHENSVGAGPDAAVRSGENVIAMKTGYRDKKKTEKVARVSTTRVPFTNRGRTVSTDKSLYNTARNNSHSYTHTGYRRMQ